MVLVCPVCLADIQGTVMPGNVITIDEEAITTCCEACTLVLVEDPIAVLGPLVILGKSATCKVLGPLVKLWRKVAEQRPLRLRQVESVSCCDVQIEGRSACLFDSTAAALEWLLANHPPRSLRGSW